MPPVVFTAPVGVITIISVFAALSAAGALMQVVPARLNVKPIGVTHAGLPPPQLPNVMELPALERSVQVVPLPAVGKPMKRGPVMPRLVIAETAVACKVAALELDEELLPLGE